MAKIARMIDKADGDDGDDGGDDDDDEEDVQFKAIKAWFQHQKNKVVNKKTRRRDNHSTFQSPCLLCPKRYKDYTLDIQGHLLRFGTTGPQKHT